jgi:hypothetical protein
VKRGAQTRQVRQTDLIAFVVARAVEDAGLPVAEALCAQIQDLAA